MRMLTADRPPKNRTMAIVGGEPSPNLKLARSRHRCNNNDGEKSPCWAHDASELYGRLGAFRIYKTVDASGAIDPR